MTSVAVAIRPVALLTGVATVAYCAYVAAFVLAAGLPALAGKVALTALVNWIFVVLNAEAENAAEGDIAP